MVAAIGNLVVMGVAVALFVATINLGKKRRSEAERDTHITTATPLTDP